MNFIRKYWAEILVITGIIILIYFQTCNKPEYQNLQRDSVMQIRTDSILKSFQGEFRNQIESLKQELNTLPLRREIITRELRYEKEKISSLSDSSAFNRLRRELDSLRSVHAN